MKRGCYWMLSILLAISLIHIGIIKAETSQETGISVSVVSYPFVEIVSPQSTTYEENDYILFQYSSNSIETVWYSLDNGENTIINESFYFQTSPGTHTIRLYGNQSNGVILYDEVTFTVNALSAPSSGGGGSSRSEPPEITIEEEMVKETIPITLKQGETKELKLLIKNDLSEEAKIRIEDLDLDNLLIKISDIEFYLKPEETKYVTFTFYADANQTPELYIEKILIQTEDYEKEISFYIDVESLDFLFDVKIELPEYPKIFYPGEDLTAIVNFYNLGKEGESEVNIEYLIKNEEKETIFGEKQILIIRPSISTTKKLKLPENIEKGDYIFYVKVSYNSKTAIASKGFTVSEKDIESKLKQIINNIKKDPGKSIIILAVIIICIWIAITGLKKISPNKRILHLLRKPKNKPSFRKYKTRIHKRIK